MDDLTKGDSVARIILILENNALLRLSMVSLVEAAGFIAIEARNADQAISILESRADIAMLVTNVVMRGRMDGVELAHAVNNLWPAVKIIVVSGRAGLSEHDLPPATILCAKPYHDDELMFEIRALIGPHVEGVPWQAYRATATH